MSFLPCHNLTFAHPQPGFNPVSTRVQPGLLQRFACQMLTSGMTEVDILASFQVTSWQLSHARMWQVVSVPDIHCQILTSQPPICHVLTPYVIFCTNKTNLCQFLARKCQHLHASVRFWHAQPGFNPVSTRVAPGLSYSGILTRVQPGLQPGCGLLR